MERLRAAGLEVPPAVLPEAARCLTALPDPEPEWMQSALRLALAHTRSEQAIFDEVFGRYLAHWRLAVAVRRQRARGRRQAPGGVGEGGNSRPGGSSPEAASHGGGRPPQGSTPFQGSTSPAPQGSTRPSTNPTRPGQDRPTTLSLRDKAGTPGSAKQPGPSSMAQTMRQGSRGGISPYPGAEANPQRARDGRQGDTEGPEQALRRHNQHPVSNPASPATNTSASTHPGPYSQVAAHHAPNARSAGHDRITPRSSAHKNRTSKNLVRTDDDTTARWLASLDHAFATPLGAAEQARMQAALHQLVGSVALRRSRRSRRYLRGRLDLRATVRQGKRYEGVPVRRCYRRRTLRRSRLLVLVDASGSVRHAARFVTALAAGMRAVVPSVQALAFVHHPVDITHLLPHPQLLSERMWEEQLPELDLRGRSDFGNTFFRLLEDHGHRLTRSTLLVVLGDARNNYVDPMTWALAEVRRRVGSLLWLNPEPRARWGQGDSVWPAYAPWVDRTARCANIADLVEIARQMVQQTMRWKSP